MDALHVVLLAAVIATMQVNPAVAQERQLSNQAELELRSRREHVVDSARRLLATGKISVDILDQGKRLYTAARIANNAYIEQVAAMIRRGDEARVAELREKHADLPQLADTFMKFVEQNTHVAGAFDWIAPTLEGLVKGAVELAKYWRQRSTEDRELKAQTLLDGTLWPDWGALRSR